uniref:Uncharacterized protein n=1 Tax=Strongyloides papillosus TaxID=174720 RepID=A0A0N5C419_STREA
MSESNLSSDDISKVQRSNMNLGEAQKNSCDIPPVEEKTTNKNTKEDFYDFPDDKCLHVPLDDIEPTVPLMEIPIELLELEGIPPSNVLFPIKKNFSIFTTYSTKPNLFAIQDAKRQRIKELCKPNRTQKEESK